MAVSVDTCGLVLQNGLLSALPYIGFWLAIVVSGQLADIVRARGFLTTTQTRKVGNSLGKVQATSDQFIRVREISAGSEESYMRVCVRACMRACVCVFVCA